MKNIPPHHVPKAQTVKQQLALRCTVARLNCSLLRVMAYEHGAKTTSRQAATPKHNQEAEPETPPLPKPDARSLCLNSAQTNARMQTPRGRPSAAAAADMNRRHGSSRSHRRRWTLPERSSLMLSAKLAARSPLRTSRDPSPVALNTTPRISCTASVALACTAETVTSGPYPP